MELPVAPQSYRPSADALVRAVKSANVMLARVVAKQSVLDGGTAFTNPDRPDVRSANWAAQINVPGDVGARLVLDQILDHFRQQGVPCQVLDGAAADWPQALAQGIAALGYRPITKHVFCLADYQPPRKVNEQLQIIPARSLYGQLPRFYQSMARQGLGAPEALAQQLTETFIDRLDEPRLDLFLGRIDKQPVASCGVITLGNIGVIHAAYTAPEHRGRGIAATLMAHVLDHCSRAQFEQVVLDRSEGCPSIPFYQRLGFRQVASYVKYWAATEEPSDRATEGR